MITSLIIFFLTLAAKLTYDRHRYLSRKTIYHGREAIVVSIALIAASYFADWKTIPLWFFGFWVLFDGFFNLLIGQPWGYLGETAKLDKLMRKYPLIIILKYFGLFASTIIPFI